MSDDSHRHFNIIIGSIAALSGLVALFTYIENRGVLNIKNNLLKQDVELKALEHDLKILEIEKAKAEVVQIYSDEGIT